MLKQNEWIDVLSEKAGVSKKEAKEYYDFVFDTMAEQISIDNPIKIAGLGVLKVKVTAAKQQVNLNSGVAELVPEHNSISFKPYVEIDPKPEAVEMEWSPNEVEVPTAAEEVVEEEESEEVAEEEQTEEVAEEEATEEEATEEQVAEETAEEETAEEETAEEETAEEEKTEEESIPVTWVYDAKEVEESEVVDLILSKTELTKEEVTSALVSVKQQVKKARKTEVEENETFNFYVLK